MAKQAPQQRRPEAAPAQPQRARVTTTTVDAPKSSFLKLDGNDELVFGRQNFLFMAIGAALILLGLLLMLGGEQPNPDTWDENIIYSTRIVTIAPLVILSGVIVEIYAIFKD